MTYLSPALPGDCLGSGGTTMFTVVAENQLQ